MYNSFRSTREWRAGVFVETQKVAPSLPFKPSEKMRIDPGFKPEKKYEKTPIHFSKEDTLIAGKRLIDSGHNPLILNFANDKRPGGGVHSGAGAQEESLFRRTNLCVTLLPAFYPIRDNEGLYTPEASTFRDTEDNACKHIEPWTGAFSTVPGLFHPPVGDDNRLLPRDVARLETKIRMICQMGTKKGHDVLLLGALGCGAWQNPPTHVAEIFRSILAEYDGVFKSILFAIMDRDGSRNYGDFMRVFQRPAGV
jgi:uncharacterized protein (TIGR02452 family)